MGVSIFVPSFDFTLPRHSHVNLQASMRMEEKTPPGLLKELKYLSCGSGQPGYGGTLTSRFQCIVFCV